MHDGITLCYVTESQNTILSASTNLWDTEYTGNNMEVTKKCLTIANEKKLVE